MKSSIKNIELLSNNITEKEKKSIEHGNIELIEITGASIAIENIYNNTITVQVNNVNGKSISKAELLKSTYKLLKKHLPDEYRISIKL